MGSEPSNTKDSKKKRRSHGEPEATTSAEDTSKSQAEMNHKEEHVSLTRIKDLISEFLERRIDPKVLHEMSNFIDVSHHKMTEVSTPADTKL